ncbi:MAG TPA: hypothetical protein VMF51_16985 [Nocardioides sp.]|uniref:hypothetical protein n=1 Tax=Nocardioides sp. TaxID=35761 RepID=UPI002B5EEF52|nr:hypothetical protein [Nocardioides sp.]HTW16831.1 hypothetical protein [Nocardioides sp.]
MSSREDARPPRHLGDYPDGAYWSAGPHPHDEDGVDEHTVQGSVIRFMWDYGVQVPLWDAEGLLPEDPEWLRRSLGVSDPLIEDLARWGDEMDALDADPRRRTSEAYDALDARARDLVQRLRTELGSRFSISYRPW